MDVHDSKTETVSVFRSNIANGRARLITMQGKMMTARSIPTPNFSPALDIRVFRKAMTVVPIHLCVSGTLSNIGSMIDVSPRNFGFSFFLEKSFLPKPPDY